MRSRSVPPTRAALRACVAALAVGAAARAAAQPPAQPPAPAAARPAAAAPDVRFMQQMIGHHAQALAMAALVPGRARSAAVRQVAERIAASQGDEIALMRQWLQARGAAPPTADSSHAGTNHAAAGQGAPHHAAPHRAAMPGMLSPAELARLGALRGRAFDRAFLAGMVRHHEGALAMVAALLAQPGAAQDPEAFRFASDVDADQRAEIARMRRLLAAGPPPAR